MTDTTVTPAQPDAGPFASNASGDKGGTTQPANQPDGFKPITSQEDFNRMVGERVNRERAKFADHDDLKAKAAQFDKLEEANKTEAQRATDALNQERARADKAEALALSLTVATEFKLGPEDAQIVAQLPDEAAQRALAERLAKQAETPARVGVSVDNSETQTTLTPDKDAAARTFFGI